MDPDDGYLKARVWGPKSGITYSGEAWIRTIHNFNDGKSYVINFTWEPEFIDYNVNYYFIQITDGYIYDKGWMYWPLDDYPGTTHLLWQQRPDGNWTPGCNLENAAPLGKLNYSLTIDTSGVARLYDGPDASGALLREESLGSSYPWYIRFMVLDGTSAGFPAGDTRLNLYDFSAKVMPIPVEIDIKPGSWPNAINLGSNGVIPVAILTIESFDATSVDPSTVQLEGLGVAVRGKSEKLLANEEDVDEDGDIDLVVKIETENLEPEAWQSGPVVLTGETYDGQVIEGWDEIIIVPPEE